MSLEHFMADLMLTAAKNEITVKLIAEKGVLFDEDEENEVSGYFSDAHREKELVVATAKPELEWLKVLVHESCHMDQYLEKDPSFISVYYGREEGGSVTNAWFAGKDYPEHIIKFCLEHQFQLEFDCEKRSVEKIKKYKLDIDIDEYIRQANSYIWLYKKMHITRGFYKTGQAPYECPELIAQMPNTFNVDYDNMPKEIFELYIKHCFN